MKIGIIVAMQSELECVRRLLENPREEQHGSSLFIIGTNGKHELILTQSGIGKVSSAIRTYELIDRYAPDCILNTGVAGRCAVSVLASCLPSTLPFSMPFSMPFSIPSSIPF